MTTSPPFTNKVIAITGAAGGIGLATANECAKRGASLALSDVNPEALAQAVSTLQTSYPDTKITHQELDVTSSSAVDAWISSTIASHGHLDGACNIAGVESLPGVAPTQAFEDLTDEHFKFIQDINVTGVFYCLRAQMRVMGWGGSIVNAASSAGLRASPRMAAYITSKHAVVGLTKAASKDTGAKGIRVNAVCPGPIDGPMMRRIADENDETLDAFAQMNSLKRLGKVEEIAKSICYLLSDDASWVNGTTLSLDGGV